MATRVAHMPVKRRGTSPAQRGDARFPRPIRQEGKRCDCGALIAEHNTRCRPCAIAARPSSRERCKSLAAMGWPIEDIAAQLNLSPRTVAGYVRYGL